MYKRQMFDTADPNSPWSAEGLTCYTTYRIAKQLYGEDYARTHYVCLLYTSKNLRHKLNRDYIETVRGVGYRAAKEGR